jgi:hemoglobin-like flavoprotein
VVPPSAAVIAQVRRSCAAVADRPVALAEAFYQHLFDMAPHTRAMFPPDMTGQMQKMTDTLLAAITTLADGDTTELEAALRRLGRQHRTHYQVAPEHYLYIGHALTRAVRDVSGPLWSGTLSSAWIAVYQWVATHMLDGSSTDLPTQAQTPIPTIRPASDPSRRYDRIGSEEGMPAASADLVDQPPSAGRLLRNRAARPLKRGAT